ncbi:MAG: carbohydrate ABC transporter permease [Sphaerochaetaceae bacterium]|nr:carbohydrate ABC transporter permease [Bacteroidales bacterium]
MKLKTIIIQIVKYVVLVMGTFLALLPLVTVLFASFKTAQEYATTSPLAIPSHLFTYWENYIIAWRKARMTLAFRNSFFIIVFTLLGSILTGTMIAYVIQRFDFRGRLLLRNVFLLANLIPGVTMQVGTYKIMSNLHMVNSIPGLIILYTGTDIIAIYIFLQYFDSIPRSLDDAAIIDGCSYIKIFFKILLPLMKPAIVTVMILKGVSSYKEFYMANLYLQTRTKYVTISTSLYTFTGEYGNQYNYICAGVIITILPALVLFLFLQKYIYNGIANGAVKE